ncbi:MAG: VCBS repeat-containing protein [Bryobacterales bacterium]
MADLDGDGLAEAVAATLSGPIVRYRREGDGWRRYEIARPPQVTRGKAVAVGGLDLDGRADLAFSAEGADGEAERVLAQLARLSRRPGLGSPPRLRPGGRQSSTVSSYWISTETAIST